MSRKNGSWACIHPECPRENLRTITVNEFIGTAILVLIGCGIGALSSLRKSLGFGSGNWSLTAFGWGMAVFVGASVAWESGAHLNPAVTLGLVLTGATSWSTVPFYLLGEFSGAIVGGLLVYVVYKEAVRRPRPAAHHWQYLLHQTGCAVARFGTP